MNIVVFLDFCLVLGKVWENQEGGHWFFVLELLPSNPLFFVGAHEPQDGVNWSRDSAGKPGINDVGLTAKLQLKDIYSFENKKLRESSLTGKIQTTLFKNIGELAWLKQLFRHGIQDPMMEVIVQFPKSILGLASKESVQ